MTRLFTTKLAYVVAMEENQQQQLAMREEDGESTSYAQKKSNIWKVVWSLQMKHKLKHFI